jgi:hypothetical protein
VIDGTRHDAPREGRCRAGIVLSGHHLMLKLDVQRTAASLLAELAERGLVVKLGTHDEVERHWHIGYAKRPGVLEITDHGASCELKVASNRDGGWATFLARELADSGRHDKA